MTMPERSPRSILVIVQRSNGDVFLSSPLIEGLHRAYGGPRIDLLVNDDTAALARTLPHVGEIHQFSYKAGGKAGQVARLLRKIFRKYDLSINLTGSDRSVLFALAAALRAISAVDAGRKKSWWKRLLLHAHYEFDSNRHIIENNTTALDLLGIGSGKPKVSAYHTRAAAESVNRMLADRGISEFIIFHPGAQYEYKVYPEKLRNELLERLDTLGVPLVVTGSKNAVDLAIKWSLPKLTNVHDFIGETSMDELIALSDRSIAYIGADTLNMHIAAAQDKRIFAIYGPTILSMWSPWCNELRTGTRTNRPVQTYGNITVFQADMPCVACGKSGCDDHHGVSDCLYRIEPDTIFKEVEQWRTTFR
ncbi:MAG: glycosyltransferase family 9 protein [Chlorobiaceae bacterium]|nr:glycosyltransferase family 9 protein [Chlorobiaceae bacterium]